MGKNYLAPNEITEYTIMGGVAKINRSNMAVLLMAIIAGIYIALAGIASSTVVHSLENQEYVRFLTGIIFPVGLMLVTVNGADLVTGNCLISMACYEKRVKYSDFFKNLGIVFMGNLIGSMVMAFLQANSGMFRMNNGKFAEFIFNLGIQKVTLPFEEVIVMAIICNIFVCSGILMTYAAKDITGKLLASFFAICAFAASGTEHLVANMYYVPVALFAKGDVELVEMSGIAAERLELLTWGNFFSNNILPVTIGNFIGGLFVATTYYFIYQKNKKTNL